MESGNTVIIECGENEIAEWLSLRCKLWSDSPEEDHLSEIRSILERPETQRVFLAQVDGKPAGFAEASIRPFVEDCRSDRIGYLEGWYVLPAYRRKGIGGDLVRAAENWARENGCEEMASDAELENERGLLAHLKLGFTETSRLVHLRKDLL